MTKSLRWLILPSLAMSLAFSASGAPVSIDDARAIAEEFLSTGGASPLQVDATPVHVAGPASAPLYYVFNSSDGNAFVMVSADDTTVPVLGFSFESGYHIQQIPAAMRWMLDGMQNELAVAPTLQQPMAPAARLRLARAAGEEKLLSTPAWSQEGPFNAMIPGRPLVGCVGTAMATIMKYYEWPPQGSGSFGGVEFNVPYAWSDMRADNYRSGFSEAEGNAVATLMWHASKSIDTQYAMSGSSAYEVRVPGALSTFFGYDPGVSYRKRSDVASQEEWDAIVKAEIDAGRPVLYCGQDVSAGHAFVCDGYRGQYLHFNWGWGGSANGYFLSTALNPTVSRTHSYNNLNTIIYNIKPAAGTIAKWSDIHITADANQAGIGTTLTDLASGDLFKVRVGNLKNLAYADFSGKIAVALCAPDGSVKCLLSQEANFSLPSMQTLYAGYVDFNSCRLPAGKTVDEADCVRIVTLRNGESEWLPVAGELLTVNQLAPVGTPASFKVTCEAADGVIPGLEGESVMLGGDYKFRAELIDPVADVLTVKANGFVLTPDANGYYTIANVRADQTISMIVQKAADVKEKRSFWVGTPGTLSQLISEEESGSIKDLTLFGTIDANDFFFMRDKMRLSRVDISGVYIAANGTNQANALPREAFRGCSSLKQVILPNSVNRFNNGCFRQCGITSIVIPANVKTYEYNIFVAASALRDIWVGRESAEFINWCVLSGVKVDLCTLHVPSERAWTNYNKAENWNTIKNIVVEKAPATTDALFAVQENNDVKFEASIEPGRVTPGQKVTFTAEYTAPDDNRMDVYANATLLTPDAEGKYSAEVNGNTIIHFDLVPPTATAGKSQWTLTDANGSIGMLTDAVNVIPGQEFSVRLNALNIPQYFDQLYWAVALTDADDNIKEFISPVNVWSAGPGANHKLNVNCCVNEANVREGNKLRVVTSANKKVWNVVEGGNEEIVASLPAINNMNPVYNITIPQVEGVNISGGVTSAVRGRDITLKMVPVNPGYRLNVFENGKKIASNASSLNHTFIALEDKEFEVEVFDPKAGGVAEFTVAPGTFHIQLTEQNVAETVVVRGQAYSLDIQAATGKDFAIKTIKTLDLSGVEIVASGGFAANVLNHPLFVYTNGMTTPASVVENIILPDNLTKIASGILKNCPNITDITIPRGFSSVPSERTTASGGKVYDYSIGDNAFGGCPKLTKIRIPGTPGTYNGSMVVAHHNPYNYSYYNLGHADPKKVTVIVPEEYLSVYLTNNNNNYYGNVWKKHGYNILSEEPVYGVTFDPTRIVPTEDMNLDRLASFLGDNVPLASYTLEGKLRLANPELPCKVFDNGNEVTLAEDGSIPVTFYNPAKNAQLSGNHHLDVVYLHDVEFNAASSLFSVVTPTVENDADYHFENFDTANPEAAVLRGVAENSTVKFGVDFAPEHAKGLELRVMLGQQELSPDADGLYAVSVSNASRAVEIFAVPGEGAVLNAEELNAIHEADAAGVASIALAGELSAEQLDQAVKMFKNLESLDLSDFQSELPENAFAGLDNLTQIVLPEVETISAGLFSGCSSLQTIEIPASVNIVGEEAFKDCSSLESIRLTGVTEIGPGAFDGCSSLTSLTILADNAPAGGEQARVRRAAPCRVNVSDDAFRGINPNCVIVLDEGVTIPVAKANYLTTASGLISETQPDGSVIDREGRIYTSGGNMNFSTAYPLAIPHHFTIDAEHAVALEAELPSIAGLSVPFDVKSIRNAEGQELLISLPEKQPAARAASETEAQPKAFLYAADADGLTLTPQASVKANVPYVASLPEAGVYTFHAAQGEVPSTPASISGEGDGYQLHSAYTTRTLPASEVYVLSDDGSAFEKAGADDEEVTLKPFSVYATSNMAPEEIPTGIYDANVETIVEDVLVVEDLRIYRDGDSLVIDAPADCTLSIYAADGRLVGILDLKAGRNLCQIPGKGVYIIADRRVLF